MKMLHCDECSKRRLLVLRLCGTPAVSKNVRVFFEVPPIVDIVGNTDSQLLTEPFMKVLK